MNDIKPTISLVIAVILVISGIIARSGIRRMDMSAVQLASVIVCVWTKCGAM
jgi:hypothetical protein